jgi:hypothetical protein
VLDGRRRICGGLNHAKEDKSMPEVVINTRFGGFSVSKEVYDCMGKKWDGYGHLSDADDRHAIRSDPELVKCVRKLGEKADGELARLCIVKVPNNVEWHIEDNDGREHIAENHRTWACGD